MELLFRCQHCHCPISSVSIHTFHRQRSLWCRSPKTGISNNSASNFGEKAELQFAVGGGGATTAAISAWYSDWLSPGGSLVGSDLVFSTKPASGNVSERIRITSAGDVGIGTPQPMSQGGGNGLEVSGNGAEALLRLSDSNNNSSVLDFAANSAGGYARIQSVLLGVAYKPLSLNPSGGNVGIGTTSPSQLLEVNGNAQVDGGIYFAGDPTHTPQTTPWTGVLCGGDYAEAMNAAGGKAKYEPGDVLVLASDDNRDVQKSGEPYSTMVAGIVATKPGVVGLRAEVAKLSDNVPMAMVGVVPTKVSAENGPIHRGDLLVTASLPGYAMKGTDRGRMLGTVIGKAMGSLNAGTGVIEVLVTLQ
jgi:hypothetical protein